MKPWTKIYMTAFGYTQADFIPSELTGEKAVDIHHLLSRKKQGEDRIENLMALTREEHSKFGDKKEFMAELIKKHWEFLEANGVKFDREYMMNFYNKYA